MKFCMNEGKNEWNIEWMKIRINKIWNEGKYEWNIEWMNFKFLK